MCCCGLSFIQIIKNTGAFLIFSKLKSCCQFNERGMTATETQIMRLARCTEEAVKEKERARKRVPQDSSGHDAIQTTKTIAVRDRRERGGGGGAEDRVF